MTAFRVLIIDSEKVYDADAGGLRRGRMFCNYIVPKAMEAFTLCLTGYPELKWK